MGLIFWKCWRVALKKFKFLMGIWIFWILYTPVKNLCVISTRITPCEIKLEISGKLSINLIIFFFCIDFFYLGFPAKFWGFRKNWDFHTFCLAWFLKGFQAKKRLVLHVLCPSHPCASLARTVLKPRLRGDSALYPLSIFAIDLLPSWSSIARVHVFSRQLAHPFTWHT